jgi:hypothetical protein
MQNDYSDPRWQKLRLKAMDRDEWKCVACGDSKSTLHVHHKKYCGNIWDSPLQDLQTLCNACHAGLGQHPKAGVWYEVISHISPEVLGPNNWHNCADKVEKDAFAIAVRNCPQCGHHEFRSANNVLSCLGCGWSMQLLHYTFLHVPAIIIDEEQAKATREAEDRAHKKASAFGTMRTWVRKCRDYGFSDEEIWSAVFPEHAVPLGYRFDADGLLTLTDLADEEAQKLRAYLTSGMSFRDVVFEIASLSSAGRQALVRSGY